MPDPTILSELYSTAHTIGYSPKMWRKSKVVLIPKISKSDYSSPKKLLADLTDKLLLKSPGAAYTLALTTNSA